METECHLLARAATANDEVTSLRARFAEAEVEATALRAHIERLQRQAVKRDDHFSMLLLATLLGDADHRRSYIRLPPSLPLP